MHTHFDPKKSKVAIVCNFYVNEFKFSQLNNKLKIYIEFFLFVALHGLIYKHLKNLYRISLMQLVQSSFFAIFFVLSAEFGQNMGESNFDFICQIVANQKGKHINIHNGNVVSINRVVSILG